MTDTPGRVVFLSGDLMFASRVSGAAKNAGLSFYFGGNFPDDETDTIRFVILDLSTRSKLVPDAPQWVADNCPDAELIAYGPHVQVAKLDAAKAAGIEKVLTRGQFDSRLASLF